MNRIIALSCCVIGLLGCNSDPCSGGGTATLKVTLSASVVGAKAILKGPDGMVREVVSTDTTSIVELAAVPSGRWTVQGQRYVTPDARVRTVYEATATPDTFCVASSGRQAVAVTWALNPTSNKLWVLNGSGGAGALLSFPASSLMASGSIPAAAKGDAPLGGDVAFDKDGNLWSLGATTVDAMVVMTATAALNTAEKKTAARSINVEGVTCFPRARGLAFDKNGNLWVTACEGKVFKLTADQIKNSGTVTPTVILSGLNGAEGLAFDKSGNLFVAVTDAGSIVRFDAASLNASSSSPSATLKAKVSDTSTDTYSANWLAFDGNGNLYVDAFGPNVIYRLGASDLSGTGTQLLNPQVRMTLSVDALLEGMMFDESGGLWVAFSAGKVARLDASQLDTSTTGGATTQPQLVMSSPDLGHGSNLAIYPAPANLPLFHSLP